MGAWGTGNFENDTALDWCFIFDENPDIKILWDAIEAVLQEEYVSSDTAVEALAALEIAACIKGRKSSDIPEEIEKWLSENSSIELPDNFYHRAKMAIQRIKGNESELNELWKESDSYKDWLGIVNELNSRITS